MKRNHGEDARVGEKEKITFYTLRALISHLYEKNLHPHTHTHKSKWSVR